MSEHQPKRGGDVEAYIKRRRDQFAQHSPAWDAINDLLDDYQLHADTGTPLAADPMHIAAGWAPLRGSGECPSCGVSPGELHKPHDYPGGA
jgi:hypothetical protein